MDRIEGNRVVIEPMTLDNLDFVLDARYGDAGSDELGKLRHYHGEVGADPDRGWFIIKNERHEPIGEISFHQRDADRVDIPTVCLAKQYQNQGYGTDAIVAFSAFLFSHLQVASIFLYVNNENEAAIRCFTKSGFRTLGVRTGTNKPYDIRIMARTTSEDQ